MLCAPSLSGESFGMVLTEAFAAGTPVIASDIAGYSDVVTDGVDGVLVPPADPQRLAEELQRAHHEPERLRGDGRGRRGERRSATPGRASPTSVEEVYERGDRGAGARQHAPSGAARVGLAPADGGPRGPARRLPSLDPAPRPRGGARARRAPGRARRRRRRSASA